MLQIQRHFIFGMTTADTTEPAPALLVRVLSCLWLPILHHVKNDDRRPGAPSGDIQDRLTGDPTVQKALSRLDNSRPGSIQANVWMQLI